MTAIKTTGRKRWMNGTDRWCWTGFNCECSARNKPKWVASCGEMRWESRAKGKPEWTCAPLGEWRKKRSIEAERQCSLRRIPAPRKGGKK